MSYEEEDTCMYGSVCMCRYLSYAEEDTCHMRRRIHTCMALYVCVCV